MSHKHDASTQARSWQALADQLEETEAGGFWKPENEGDSLAMRLDEVETGAGKQGTSTIYSGVDEDGNPVSFWGSAILDRKLKHANSGDMVLVKYLGWRQSKTGNSYKAFSVKVVPSSELEELPF